jgi:hypothetical protein
MVTYFYRVDEFVRTFGRGESREEAFTHSLDFHFDTTRESKLQAYGYYKERLDVLAKEEEYFLPFTPVKDTKLGPVAIYSLTLYFVECYNEEEYYLHGLEGVSETEMAESKKIEEEVLEQERPSSGLTDKLK